jgi:hypothetical protein
LLKDKESKLREERKIKVKMAKRLCKVEESKKELIINSATVP